MATPRYVQHVRGAEEPVHCLGDEAAIPGATRGIDAGLARVADGLAADAFIGRRRARAARTAISGAGPLPSGRNTAADVFHSVSNSNRMLSMVALMRGTTWMPFFA